MSEQPTEQTEKELTPEEQEKEKKKKEKKAAADAKKKEKEAKKLEAKLEREREAEARAQAELEKIKDTFGHAPLIQSQAYKSRKYTPVDQLTKEHKDEIVTVRGRLQTIRAKGKLGFIVLRDGISTVQGVVAAPDRVPPEAVKWLGRQYPESVVDVVGQVTVPEQPIDSCSQSDVELAVTSCFVVSSAPPSLPFQLADASRKEEHTTTTTTATEGEAEKAGDDKQKANIVVNQDTRLNTRWLDLRTKANQAVFRINSRVCQEFRSFLYQRDFVEIHTPKTIGVQSEGGALVFKLNYHGRDAFLAQSPQLYKQMCINSDLRRVMEVGPVFRAENSQTHRHLCEFTGLDWEMEIKEHYYEVLDLAEELFTSIFKRLNETCAREINEVRAQFPFEDLVWRVSGDTIKSLGVGIIENNVESTDEFKARIRNEEVGVIRIPFPDACRLINVRLEELRKTSEKPDEEFPLQDPLEDLSTPTEKLLGECVKQRYGVDYFICDKYPYSARPFYTMRCPENPNYCNSYDMMIRGEEISSGAQRVHEPEMLMKQIVEKGVKPESIQDYVDSFKLGAYPHGGMGVGLERVVMLFLGLHNIRVASLFPRDPKRLTP